MRPYVRALAARKLPAEAVDLPRSGRSVVKAEKAVPTFIEKVPAGSIGGGHSYGGRVASMAATGVRYAALLLDRKSTRLNSSHDQISYAVFCLKKKKKNAGTNTSVPLDEWS